MPVTSSKIVVLNPTVSVVTSRARMASRPDSLRGGVLGLLSNNRPSADRILVGLAQRLTEKYELSRVVHRKKHYIGEPSPAHIIDELATSCDVVITALGN